MKTINRRKHSKWVIQAGTRYLLISETAYRGTARQAEIRAREILAGPGISTVSLYFEDARNRTYYSMDAAS